MVSSVSSLRHVIALVLLALWLPATQHCGLEAAGLIAADVAHDATTACCEKSGGPCTHDECGVVESDLIKRGNEDIQVPAPTLVACTCFLCLQLLPPEPAAEPALTATASDHPQHWVPVWHFARRAAPLSRAPSLLG